MQKNPFTLSFGRKPNEYINRANDEAVVYDTFTQLPVTDQVYVLTAVRGGGKTVTMTSLTSKFELLPDWIVIKISPMDNILDALYRVLVYDKNTHTSHTNIQIGVSLPNINFSVSDNKPKKNLVHAIDEILEDLQKRNIKLLVTIDEITNTLQMQEFISAFQLWITNNRYIFFLATALYDELERLQNVHNLTFLYRAPRIALTPLRPYDMAETYRTVFDISEENAKRMAFFTKGYPLAFQTLGYITWEHKNESILSTSVLQEFDTRIAAAAYDKLWSELSEKDCDAMIAIARTNSDNVKDIREQAGMDANYFNQYRKRLKARGMIDTSRYGKILFALPRLREYIQNEVLFF